MWDGCALEGCSAFKNRVEAFRQTRLQDNVAGVPFHLMPSPMSLVVDHAALIASIRAKAPAPAAVVIDTLNRSTIAATAGLQTEFPRHRYVGSSSNS
jgi:hypothetical protein